MASLPAGTLLGDGRYKILTEIARGGSAVVYKAVDQTTGDYVACKILNVNDEGNLTVPAHAVRREIATAAGLRSCPHVVHLRDFFAEGPTVVMVWELVEGPDLLDLLNEHGGRMDEATAAHYFVQLARAVRVIHARGLCHRDVKAENCCVDRRSRRAKLLDFGLARRCQSAVTLGVGTPDYMSPELVVAQAGDVRMPRERATGSYDPEKVDAWSLGVLLYLLVCGKYCFEDPLRPGDVVATLRNIVACSYRPIPASLSPACADLIAHLLVRDPAARLSLAEVLQHPFCVAAAAALGEDFDMAEDSSGSAGAEAGSAGAEAPGSAAAGAEALLTAPAHAAAAQQAAAEEEDQFMDVDEEEEVAEGGGAVREQLERQQAGGIAAFPTEHAQRRTASFSFQPMEAVSSKATPSTPRVVHLEASGSVVKAPPPPSPPSHGCSLAASPVGCATVAAPAMPQQSARGILGLFGLTSCLWGHRSGCSSVQEC